MTSREKALVTRARELVDRYRAPTTNAVMVGASVTALEEALGTYPPEEGPKPEGLSEARRKRIHAFADAASAGEVTEEEALAELVASSKAAAFWASRDGGDVITVEHLIACEQEARFASDLASWIYGKRKEAETETKVGGGGPALRDPRLYG